MGSMSFWSTSNIDPSFCDPRLLLGFAAGGADNDGGAYDCRADHRAGDDGDDNHYDPRRQLI